MATAATESLIKSILDQKMLNPHSGFDVERDDVDQYLEEAESLEVPVSVDGFKMWLTSPTTTEGLLAYGDMISRT